MTTTLLILAIIALFLVLGKAADGVVTNVRRLGAVLHVPIFVVGLCLGALTTLPEFVIGLNALANGAPDLTLGNLFGGVIVLFAGVLGLAATLNGNVATGGRLLAYAPIAIYLFLPIALGLDGRIGLWEGALLVFLYIGLIYHLFKTHPPTNHNHIDLHQHTLARSGFKLIVALVLVVVASNLVVRATLALLASFEISPFVIGTVAFAVGTNLPEFIVTVRAWRRGVRNLSLSNIVGSSLANPLVIGFFATLSPLPVQRNSGFLFLTVFLLFLLLAVGYFYKSDRALSRREGILLMACYVIYLIGHLAFSAAA